MIRPWMCTSMIEFRRGDVVLVSFPFVTPSHAERKPLGWAAFAQLREAVSLPIYGLGGLCPSDLGNARRHGAQGVAAIRGLWPA